METGYRAVRQIFLGFEDGPVTVTVLSALSATSATLGSSRAVAAALIVAFLVLALRLLGARLAHPASSLASVPPSCPAAGQRRLLLPDQSRRSGRVRRAWRRSSTTCRPSSRAGSMSCRGSECACVRRSGVSATRSRRASIGPRCSQLALKTAVDAVQASGGRLSARTADDGATGRGRPGGLTDGTRGGCPTGRARGIGGWRVRRAAGSPA